MGKGWRDTLWTGRKHLQLSRRISKSQNSTVKKKTNNATGKYAEDPNQYFIQDDVQMANHL